MSRKLSLVVLMLFAASQLSESSAGMDEYEQPYYSHSNGGFYGDTEGYMSMEWGAGGGMHTEKNCIDIPQNMSLCKDIGYNQMRIPNLLDHDTVREVTQQASSWVPLLGIRCHPDTKLFLCSLFSPVCLAHPIWPCRTLCEAVKNGCEALMLKYGFPWPEMLRCDKFPLDNDLCIGLQHDNQPAVEETTPKEDNICASCKHPDTYEAIADNFCSADFALRIRIDDFVISGTDLKLSVYKKIKKLKKGSLKKRDTRDMHLYIQDGSSCECNHVTQNVNQGSGKKDKQKYLVMGNRDGDKLTVQYLSPMDMSNPDFKKAMRAMSRNTMCGQNGLPTLAINEASNSNSKGKKRKNRNKGGNKKEETPTNNNDNSNGDPNTGDNTELKRRKNCKNPRKCISTASTTAPPSSNNQRRRSGDRSNRKNGRRERNRGSTN